MSRAMNRLAKFIVPIVMFILFVVSQDGGEMSIVWLTIMWLIGGLYVVKVLVEDLDRQFYGFLKTYLNVHLFKRHLNPTSKQGMKMYVARVRDLKKKTRAGWWSLKKDKWEYSLIEKIIEESGWYTEKFTGKRNNKHQVKLRRGGQRYRNRSDKKR